MVNCHLKLLTGEIRCDGLGILILYERVRMKSGKSACLTILSGALNMFFPLVLLIVHFLFAKISPEKFHTLLSVIVYLKNYFIH